MKIALRFVCLLVFLGGCVTERQQAPVSKAHPAGPLLPRKTVVDPRVVVEPGLREVIRIVGLRTSESPEGFLRIQVDVENRTGSPQHFGYRIDWFDQQGQPLPLASTSTPWMLLAHETSFMATTSPTPAARDFRVTFIGPGG